MVTTRIITLITVLLITLSQLYAQQNIDWLKGGGGFDNDQVIDQCVDSNGNLYLTGKIRDSFSYDTMTLIVTDEAFLLMKLAPDGSPIWATTIANPNREIMINDITIDHTGAIYIAGAVEGSINLLGETINTLGDQHGLVMKIDQSGNLIWLETFESNHSEALAIESSTQNGNSIYITGFFRQRFIYQADSLISIDTNSTNGFIARLNSSGAIIWVKEFGGTWVDEGNKLAVDDNDMIYFSGEFVSNAYFDSLYVFNSNTGISLFVASVDTNGNFNWVITPDMETNCSINDFIANNNHLYFTGTYTNEFSIYSNSITSNGKSDIFIGKFDNTGTIEWLESYGDTKNDVCDGIAMLPENHLLITGSTGGDSLLNGFNTDILLLELDTNGTYIEEIIFGSEEDVPLAYPEIAKNISCSASGDCFISGEFKGAISIAGNEINTNRLNDIFVGKISKRSTAIPEKINPGSEIIRFYPNPADKSLFISVINDIEVEEMIILNAIGGVHYKVKGPIVNNSSINTETWEQGIYFAFGKIGGINRFITKIAIQ